MIELHDIRIDEAALAEICRRYQVRELSVFGSVLRDDFRKKSDVDVLVEFEPESHPTLFTLSRLQRELARLFRRRVDLGMKGSLRPLIRDEVLSQARVLYAA
jgi:uncharacterized protein